MWWLFSSLILLVLLWLLAEWGVWKLLHAYFKEVNRLGAIEEFFGDVRQGSSMGVVSLGPSGIFEVQQDGTVVGIAPSQWSDESPNGRDGDEF